MKTGIGGDEFLTSVETVKLLWSTKLSHYWLFASNEESSVGNQFPQAVDGREPTAWLVSQGYGFLVQIPENTCRRKAQRTSTHTFYVLKIIKPVFQGFKSRKIIDELHAQTN
jgi:hypothetical protein